jgi:hypothetical protein
LHDNDKNVLQTVMEADDNLGAILKPLDDKGTAKPNDVAVCLTEGSDLSTSWPTEMFTMQQRTNTITQEVKKKIRKFSFSVAKIFRRRRQSHLQGLV